MKKIQAMENVGYKQRFLFSSLKHLHHTILYGCIIAAVTTNQLTLSLLSPSIFLIVLCSMNANNCLNFKLDLCEMILIPMENLCLLLF